MEEKMKYTISQAREARKTDLYAYMLENHRNEIVVEGNSIRLSSNHSISIKEHYSGYYDFATDEKGNSIDFLVRHMGYTVPQAVLALAGSGSPAKAQNNVFFPIPVKPEELNTETPVFPKTGKDCRKVYAYLINRGINPQTLRAIISRGLLYQDTQNNAVFINREQDWGEIRGTNTYKPYHGMVKNCRPDGCWYFNAVASPTAAYICESAIDAISLYLLRPQDRAFFVSIGGAAKQQAIDRIKSIPGMSVIIAVDNDKAGDLCRMRNPELENIIPSGKDWNDDLMQAKKIYKKGENQHDKRL